MNECLDLNTLKREREREKVLAPDGHDVREEQQEAENLEVPTAGEVLEGHHDQ